MDERKILYQQFLREKAIYNLNVSYWRIKLQKALNEKISSKDQLIKNKDNKGKNFYDGNPMFSYYNPRKEKAIRVIQEDPSEINKYSDIKLIEAWISKILVTDSSREDKEVPELVISLFLTKSTVEKCVELAKDWFNGNLSKTNLESKLTLL